MIFEWELNANAIEDAQAEQKYNDVEKTRNKLEKQQDIKDFSFKIPRNQIVSRYEESIFSKGQRIYFWRRHNEIRRS